MVREWLARQPEGYVAIIIDADNVATGLEDMSRWLDDEADLVYYHRDWNHEITAGNYIVRNTEVGVLCGLASYLPADRLPSRHRCLSLALSLSHTHTHRQTHTLARTRSRALSLCLSLTHVLKYTLSTPLSAKWWCHLVATYRPGAAHHHSRAMTRHQAAHWEATLLPNKVFCKALVAKLTCCTHAPARTRASFPGRRCSCGLRSISTCAERPGIACQRARLRLRPLHPGVHAHMHAWHASALGARRDASNRASPASEDERRAHVAQHGSAPCDPLCVIIPQAVACARLR